MRKLTWMIVTLFVVIGIGSAALALNGSLTVK